MKTKKYSSFISKNDKHSYFGRNDRLNSQLVHVPCIESRNKVYIINYNKKQ